MLPQYMQVGQQICVFKSNVLPIREANSNGTNKLDILKVQVSRLALYVVGSYSPYHSAIGSSSAPIFPLCSSFMGHLSCLFLG